MNVINKVGKKNVEEAYYESLEANDFFENKKFIEAGESFLKASSLNPLRSPILKMLQIHLFKLGKMIKQ